MQTYPIDPPLVGSITSIEESSTPEFKATPTEVGTPTQPAAASDAESDAVQPNDNRHHPLAAANDTADEVPKMKSAAAPTKSKRSIRRTDFPDEFQLGSPVPTTIENVEFMLQRIGITARYNVIKKKLEIIVPGHYGSDDNRDNVTMAAVVSEAALNGLMVSLVPQFVEAIGNKNIYNPVANWINSKPWDSQDRLARFCDTVVERDGYPAAMKTILLTKWLLSAVAAALMPKGFRNRGVLTLQGPQHIGKTSWALALVSDPALREQCVKVDHHLDSSNKDSIVGAITHWLVEIGELDSSFKKDIARLKGFLTANFDKVRRPYARVDAEYQRRTVFVATVNEVNFLVDTTGNSRWWTIAVDKLDFNHGIDMQQLYAQLAVNFANGDIWWLTDEEEAQLALLNEPHQSISVIDDLVRAHFDASRTGRADNPRAAAGHLLVKLGIRNPTVGQAKECAAVLRKLVGPSSRVNGYNVWQFPCTVVNDANGERILLAADVAKPDDIY